jgi:hypothetical protein
MLKSGVIIAHTLISALFILACIGGNCTHSMKRRTVAQAISTADISFPTVMWIVIALLPLSILLATYLFGKCNRGTRIALIGALAMLFGLIILTVNISEPQKYIYLFPLQGVVWTMRVFREGLPEFGWDGFYLHLAAVSWWFILFGTLLVKELILADHTPDGIQNYSLPLSRQEKSDSRALCRGE